MRRFMDGAGSVILAAMIFGASVTPSAYGQQAVNDTSASKAIHQTILSNIDPGGDLLVVANMDGAVDDVVNTIITIMAAMPAQDGNDQARKDIATKLPPFLKKNGLFGLRGFGLSVVPRPDGLNDVKSFICRDPAVKDTAVWRLMSSGQPRKMAGLGFLPADTVYASVGDGDAKMLWKLIRSSIKELASPETYESFDKAVAGFSAKRGFDADNTIASLGEECFFSLQLSTTAKIDLPSGAQPISIPKPSFLIGLAVTNDSAATALSKILQGIQMPVTKTQSEGSSLSSFDLPLPLPVQIQPTYTVVGNFLLIGSSPEVVTSAIKASRTGNGLASTAEFKKYFEGQPMINNGLSYMSPRISQTIIAIQKQSPATAGTTGNPLMGSALGKMFGMKSNDVNAVVWMNTKDGIRTSGISSRNGRETVASMIMFPVGLLGAIAIPSFVKARSTAQNNSCINNLRQIDSAVEQWALAEKKNDGDPVDRKGISRYIRGGAIPKCPQGGAYTIKKVGDAPTCSKHGALGSNAKPTNTPAPTDVIE